MTRTPERSCGLHVLPLVVAGVGAFVLGAGWCWAVLAVWERGADKRQAREDWLYSARARS